MIAHGAATPTGGNRPRTRRNLPCPDCAGSGWIQYPRGNDGAQKRFRSRSERGGLAMRLGPSQPCADPYHRSKVLCGFQPSRSNQLHPPFDNPAIRRALLGAVDQAEAMSAIAGSDRSKWRDDVGLFGTGSPLANDVGIDTDTLLAPRNGCSAGGPSAAANASKDGSFGRATHDAAAERLARAVEDGCVSPTGNRGTGSSTLAALDLRQRLTVLPPKTLRPP